jgi:hypothetical protein
LVRIGGTRQWRVWFSVIFGPDARHGWAKSQEESPRMVDPERVSYRPRRALIEPDGSTDSSAVGEFHGSNGASAEPDGQRVIAEPEPIAESPEDTGDDWASSRRSIFADLEDDVAPPLYREESQSPTSAETTASTSDDDDTDPAFNNTDTGRQTWVRSALAGGAQRPRTRDEDATSILPRTSSGSRNTHSWQDSIDDFSDLEEDRSRIDRRLTLGLIIAGVAAVVALGVWLIVAAVRADETVAPNPDPTGAPTAPASGEPALLLDDNSMIKAADAKRIAQDRVWKVALTQRGTNDDSAQAACLGGDPIEGSPAAAQTILRLLSANGKQPPGLLHEAHAFTSPEEAAQAYAVAAKTLGGCNQVGAYVRSGWSVTGLGDVAVGVVVAVRTGATTDNHSVVLNRTGKVVNVADVVQRGDPAEIGSVASALAVATGVQCRNAGGACPGDVSVRAAPPPLSGDELGFLAAGDLPPVGNVASLWVGDAPDVPQDEFVGSQCENLTWSKTPANSRTARTYLLEQGADPGFGLDEIILTMKNEKAASDFVGQLRKTVANCPKRKLTATVPKPISVAGIGAQGTKITGWTATVSQKVGNGSLKYRVGAVASGSKVIYTFLSPKDKLDLTDSQWKAVTVRAGQRATQVK